MAPRKKKEVAIIPPQQPVETLVSWDQAIKRGKECLVRASDIQWELGELADRIEPKYGDETLKKFAEELTVSPLTLRNYRAVFRAFPQKNLRRFNSFGVCAVFASQEDRLKLVAKRTWTVTEANKFIKARKEKLLEKANNERGPDTVEEEDEQTENPEERWQRSLSNYTGDILAMTSLWKKQFGDWRKFKVPSDLMKLALQAEEIWSELVHELREKTDG
jgi:hypothetical protein